MKKLLTNSKRYILTYSTFFIVLSIIINFILYLFNIRFRNVIIIGIIIISAVSFIAGVIQLILKFTEDSKKARIVFMILFLLIILILSPIIYFVFLLSVFLYQPEHIVVLNDKKYVARVESFLHVNVYYYDYYGPILMGNKVKIFGYFGKGGYDPFINEENVEKVEYTYYDNNGKVERKQKIQYIKDINKKVIDKNIIEDSSNTTKFNQNENFVLPEQLEVLCEKKFNNKILRFGKVDSTLASKILVNVVKSEDNGKNFYTVSKDVLEVKSDNKFVFLNENQAFTVPSKIYLDKNTSNYFFVTNDGGLTFNESKINYDNKNVEFITLEKLPYYYQDVLKVQYSVYEAKSSGDGYECKLLTFTSCDKGLTWTLDK